MKKLFITVLAVLALGFTGCHYHRSIERQAAFDAKYAKLINNLEMSEGKSTGRTIYKGSFISLEKVGYEDGRDIYKDKYTGVLYFVSTYNTTPIMEADGTCLTWDEWIKRTENN